MKNFLFLIALFLSFKIVHSQQYTYNHFLDSNLTWRVTFDGGECSNDRQEIYEYFTGKDSIINNLKYTYIDKRKIRYLDICNGGKGLVDKGFIREDILQKKVYLFFEGKDTLLYDFSLNVGDTLRSILTTTCQNDFVVINYIDTIIDNFKNKRKEFGFGNENCFGWFIEGIGSSQGLFEPLNHTFNYSILDCYSQNKNGIYGYGICDSSLGINNDLTIKPAIYPNPVELSSSLSLNFSTPEPINELKIYNSLGVLVFYKSNIHSTQNYQIYLDQSFTKGIYFIKVSTSNQNYSTTKFLIH